jgi:hypothetical protein
MGDLGAIISVIGCECRNPSELIPEREPLLCRL